MFGGLGTGAGAGSLFGSTSPVAAADDPYNIPIDLNKLKNPHRPVKSFEEKTSEEQIEALQEMSKNIEATGAKSILKKPGRPPSEAK